MVPNNFPSIEPIMMQNLFDSNKLFEISLQLPFYLHHLQGDGFLNRVLEKIDSAKHHFSSKTESYRG